MPTMVQEIATVSPIQRAEAMDLFDSAAKYFLNMSGSEFLDDWSAQRFGSDPDTQPGVMEVASLIPLLER